MDFLSWFCITAMVVLNLNGSDGPPQPVTSGDSTVSGSVTLLRPACITIMETQAEGAGGSATCYYDRSTPFIDDREQPVSTESARPGVPITVTYGNESGRLVAKSITVHKPR